MTEKKVITAEFLDIEDMLEAEEPEKPEERSLDLLLTLSYSEMTDEEIERVIDYRAEIKKRDDEFEARMALQKESMDAMIAIHEDMANKAQTVLDKMVAHAIDRYDEVS